MADYPFPSHLPARVEVTRLAAQRATRSPATFSVQVIDRGGRAIRLAIDFQTMPEALASDVLAFLRRLDGARNRFYLDLDPYCPGWDPAPGIRLFRLESPESGHGCDRRTVWRARLVAMEDVYPGSGAFGTSHVIAAQSVFWQFGWSRYHVARTDTLQPGALSWTLGWSAEQVVQTDYIEPDATEWVLAADTGA